MATSTCKSRTNSSKAAYAQQNGTCIIVKVAPFSCILWKRIHMSLSGQKRHVFGEENIGRATFKSYSMAFEMSFNGAKCMLRRAVHSKTVLDHNDILAGIGVGAGVSHHMGPSSRVVALDWLHKIRNAPMLLLQAAGPQ